MATKFRKYIKSFTLIELIIVIAIIAVLWATVFLLLTQWMSKGRDSKRLTDINTISKSFSIYQLEYSSYPIPDWKLVPWKINENVLAYVWELWDSVVNKLWNLNKIPKDPQTKQNYLYWITYDAKEYQFWVVMEKYNKFSLLVNVYADEQSKTKVDWNYNWIISYNENNINKYANVPSLLFFSAEWNLDSIPLDDNNNTCYIVDWWSNIPQYSKCNQTTSDIIETNTWLSNNWILIVDNTTTLSDDEIKLMWWQSVLSKEMWLNNWDDIVSKLPVDWVCWNSNSQTFFQKPIWSLCEAWNSSEVILSGNQYEWTCDWLNGWWSESCYANLLQVYDIEDWFEKITAWSDLTCIIDTNEDLWCWWTNKYWVIKSIKSNDDFIVPIPQKISWVSNVKKVALWSTHICVLEWNWDVKCAWWNDFWQLWIWNNNDSSIFIQVASSVKLLDVNSKRTCVVNNLNEMYCRWRTEVWEFTTWAWDLSYNSPIKITLATWTTTIKDFDVWVYSICYIDQIDDLYCIWRSYSIPHSSSRVQYLKMNTPEKVKIISIWRYNWSFVSTTWKVYVFWKYEWNWNVGNWDQFLSNHIPQLLTWITANKLLLYRDTSCFTDMNDKLYCWWNNFNNEISSENISNKLIYEQSSIKDSVKYLWVWVWHVCVVNYKNSFSCIWSNKFWQLWNGYIDNELVKSIPYNVNNLTEIERRSMNYKQTAWLDSNWDIYTAWVNSYWQLWVWNNNNSKIFQKVVWNINFKLMDFNPYWNGCWVSNDDKLYCWWDNSTLQLWVTWVLYSNIPLLTEWISNVKDIMIAYRSMCIIKKDNSMRCRWASSWLWIWASSNTHQFQQVLDSNIKMVVWRRLSVCALNNNWEVYCWWGNTWLTVWNLNTWTVTTANKVSIDNVEQISMWDRQVCWLKNDWQVYCWWWWMSWELWNWQNQNSAMPVKVLWLSWKQVVQVVSGNQHNCALTSQWEVYCWWFWTFWQIWNWTFNNVSTATKVSWLANVKNIVASWNISCAEKLDWARYCWWDISNMWNWSR